MVVLTRLSSWLSNLFNPLFSFLYYFVYSAFVSLSIVQASIFLGKFFLIFLVPILGYIYYNVRKGKFTNMDVSHQGQRRALYYFVIGIALVYTIVSYLLSWETPYFLYPLMILLLVMMGINFWIKVSMHTTFNCFIAALFYQLNPTIGIIWIVLTLVVAISRLILKRHTLTEVFLGLVLGSLAAYSVL